MLDTKLLSAGLQCLAVHHPGGKTLGHGHFSWPQAAVHALNFASSIICPSITLAAQGSLFKAASAFLKYSIVKFSSFQKTQGVVSAQLLASGKGKGDPSRACQELVSFNVCMPVK